MKRELRTTRDGSPTLYSEKWNQHYHSVHGAFSESMHVFLLNGLALRPESDVRILEVGFGTGINAFLTWRELKELDKRVHYHTLEAFPLKKEEWSGIQVSELQEEQVLFEQLHELPWEEDIVVNSQFSFHKSETDLLSWEPSPESYDLIYFDAFAPSTQPELWTVEVFEKCMLALAPGGTLVTYCANGQIKRNMKAAGLSVKALPGPPKKREMTQATKLQPETNK